MRLIPIILASAMMSCGPDPIYVSDRGVQYYSHAGEVDHAQLEVAEQWLAEHHKVTRWHFLNVVFWPEPLDYGDEVRSGDYIYDHINVWLKAPCLSDTALAHEFLHWTGFWVDDIGYDIDHESEIWNGLEAFKETIGVECDDGEVG